MKKLVYVVFFAAILFGCSDKSTSGKYNGYEKKADLEKPETTVDKMSYTFGYDLTTGVNMMDSANSKLNFDYLIAGIIDGLEQNNPMLDKDERMALIQEIQKIQTEAERIRYNKKMQDMEKVGEEFAKIGPAFIEANKKKEGWKETSTGLQYKPIKTTDGPKPTEDMVISANLRGELMNGEVFENTFETNKPIDMPIEGLVPAFREALTMMSVGDIYEFVMPPLNAFGQDGSGSKIPPNSVLIMKIELLKIISTAKEYREKMRRPDGM